MIFGDLTAKVEKQVKELGSPSAQRRLKAISVLSEVAEEDAKPVRIALPELVAALVDESAGVRVAASELLNVLAKARASWRKEIVKGVLELLPEGGAGSAQAMALLRKHASAAKEAVEAKLPELTAVLDGEDGTAREAVAEALEQVGVPARRYVLGVAEARRVMEEAALCGAELEKANYMLNAARTAMEKGYHAEVQKDLELTMELANNARRLVRLWRANAPGVKAVDIATGGRLVAAAGSDQKVRLMDGTGAALWSASVPDGATALRISPDESMVVVAGADGHLHAFGRRGERLWSTRLSAPAAALGVTEQNVTVACCSDNNIYTVGPRGALVDKHWTERPGWRLGVSGDGENIVVTFRDHNVYCYDRNLFLRWKFMGGIWNDVAISRDGESVVAGSQGSEVAMFSKIGMVAWKARSGGSVAHVAISAGGDCVYFADQQSLQSYDRSGRPLLNYRTTDPVQALATDSTGGYVAVGLADRFVVVRNREMVRQLVSQSGVFLENVSRLGVDTGRPAALLEKARQAFEANDYETGSSSAGEAWRLLDEAKNQRAGALVASVQQVIAEAKALGGDTAKAEQLVRTAADSLRRGHMDRVLLLLGQAREEAEISRRVREEVARTEKEARAQNARKAIQEAISMTDEAVEFGIEPGQPEVLLQKAISASDGGDYDRAMHYLGQLQDLVKAEKERLPQRIEKDFQAAVALLAKGELSADEADRARGSLSGAIVYYEKVGELRRLAESCERLGSLEEKRGKIAYSKFLLQKAVNTYFKIGEIDQVLLLLVERMKKLEAISDKKVTECTIEELFLIYRDGRLIHHNTRRLRPEVDNQILGGMLIAIQHFVGDSFRGRDHLKGGEILNELRYGKTRIMIEGGRWVHLALVISGTEPEDMRERMKKVIVDIEEKYRATLETWDGDASKLWGAKKMVEPLITWM